MWRTIHNWFEMGTNYYVTGVEEERKENELFTAVMQELIEYKYSDMDMGCEQRARRVIRFVRQREKEKSHSFANTEKQK